MTVVATYSHVSSETSFVLNAAAVCSKLESRLIEARNIGTLWLKGIAASSPIISSWEKRVVYWSIYDALFCPLYDIRNNGVWTAMRDTVQFKAYRSSRSLIIFAGSSSASITTGSVAPPRAEIIIPEAFSFLEVFNDEPVATFVVVSVDSKAFRVVVLYGPVDDSIIDFLFKTLHTPLTRHTALRRILHKP